jgi:bifunctional enzyme CysN/CysC
VRGISDAILRWKQSLKDMAKDLLRFITCGSVDDGKSTLIGRLLNDSQLIPDDQLLTLAKDSGRHGSLGDDIDFALLLDGLVAEREQGITIDVAWRFFSTDTRSFIVADTPGHEQYTRNMATGASNAELAIILVDARKGVLVQTRRHSLICALLGIRDIVLAVNKMDLVGYGQETFERIVRDYSAFASQLGFRSIAPIPVSARFGDNIAKSGAMTWYRGPALLPYLETVDVEDDVAGRPFRFPVQWVNRPNPDFRGYAGTVASGVVAAGDPVVVAASGQTTFVKELLTCEGPQLFARSGDAITMTLTDEIDLARGDMLVGDVLRPEVSDQFAAHVIWMSEHALMPGRSYLGRIGTRTTPITVTGIKYKIDVNTREHLAAPTLELNDIGVCNLATGIPVAFDPYRQNRKTGCFIMIDRSTNQTVAAGMIDFGLRRGANLPWQPLLVSKTERAAIKGQRAAIIWFTGLSGAGKSTIANIVEQQLHAMGYHTMLLDGDNVRHGLNRDLGFTEADRVENIRRAGEVARLMAEAGLIVLCSFISPYRSERSAVRNLVGEGEFIEVFVDTPIEECAQRDAKGLYAKAKAGLIKNFTGFDAPYEAPSGPEVHVQTLHEKPEHAARRVIMAMAERKIIGGPARRSD